MSRLSSRLLRSVAVAAATLAVSTSAPAAAAAPRTTTDVPAATAGWLVQQFSDAHNHRVPGGDHIELSFNDGTKDVFYFDGGGTADAAFALAATGSGKDKIDAAVTYLSAHLNEYVDYSGVQGGPFFGSIGKAALAALVDGHDANKFGGHHLLSELKADECATGSTTCTPGANANVFSSVSTSFIVIAEARGAVLDGGRYAPSTNLVNLLLGEQCAIGGFSSTIPAGTGSACAAEVDATGYAVMALQALGGHTTQIAKAARWLEAQRRPDGAWSANGGPNVNSTALAAAALRIAGRPATSSRKWLAGQQVIDGPTVGTGSTRGALKYQGAFDANSSIKATSDGVFGLVDGASLATVTAARATRGTAVLALDPPTVAKSSVAQGSTQTITGTGFTAREQVVGSLGSAPVTIGRARASANGTVTVRFTVPRSAPAGTHTLTLTGASSNLSSSVRFTVTRAPAARTSSAPTTASAPGSSTPTTSAPPLAATGRDGRETRAEVLLGVGLLALGSGAVLLGRRRGRHSR